MWRDFAVGIEAESDRVGSEFGARGLGFVTGPLPHQQPPANATDQDRELVLSLTCVEAYACLTRGICGALRQAIEIPVHQLRRPSLRNVAGERIDRKNGA